MSDPAQTYDKLVTYGDYLGWPDDQRWEIIDGIPYDMSPSPSRRHQEILHEIVRQLAPQLEGSPCRGYFAPLDVRLPDHPGQKDPEIMNVVQPDFLIVCDKAKLDDSGVRGAPDFVAEVLSPSTAVKDLREKTDLYGRHGVQEYWAIHPSDRVVYVFIQTATPPDSGPAFGDPRLVPGEGVLELSAIAAVAEASAITVDLTRLFA